jgi:hypothetical protein
MKMGRPKLEVGAAKEPFAMRFSANELKLFKKAARADKLTVREWMTKTLLEKALQKDAEKQIQQSKPSPP